MSDISWEWEQGTTDISFDIPTPSEGGGGVTPAEVDTAIQEHADGADSHGDRAWANETFAVLAHNHDGVYQPAGSYAPAAHAHDGVYQPAGSYAPAIHSHDYAPTNHSHSSLYQPLGVIGQVGSAALAGSVSNTFLGSTATNGALDGTAFGTCIPFMVGATVDAIVFRVGNAHVGATARFGIFATNSVGKPIPTLLASGTIDLGTTGWRLIPVTPFVIPSPFLFGAACTNGTATTGRLYSWANASASTHWLPVSPTNNYEAQVVPFVVESCTAGFTSSVTFNVSASWQRQYAFGVRYA
jgi:hypothetical protein